MGCCATKRNNTVNDNPVTQSIIISTIVNKDQNEPLKTEDTIAKEPKILNAWEEALKISSLNCYTQNSSLTLLYGFIRNLNIQQLVPNDIKILIHKYMDNFKRSLYGIGENGNGSLGIGRTGRSHKFTQSKPNIDVSTLCNTRSYWLFCVSMDNKLYFTGQQNRNSNIFGAPSITNSDSYRMNQKKRAELFLHPFFDGSTPARSIKMISSKAGDSFYAISMDNKFYGFGRSSKGYGSNDDRFVDVPKLLHSDWINTVFKDKLIIIDIKSANDFVVFLTSNGDVYGCGDRDQLNFPKQNDNDTHSLVKITKLPFIKDVLQMDCYQNGVLYLCKDGNVYGREHNFKKDFVLNQDYDQKDEHVFNPTGKFTTIKYFDENNIKIQQFLIGGDGPLMYCITSNYHLFCFGIPSISQTGIDPANKIVLPQRMHADVFDENKAKILKLDAGYAHFVTLCECNGLNQVITMGWNDNAQCSPQLKETVSRSRVSCTNIAYKLKQPHLLTNKEIGVNENATVINVFASRRNTCLIIEENAIQ